MSSDAPFEPPVAADETTAVLSALDRVRALLRWKCTGLGVIGSQTNLPPSAMTLSGLLKHMALVEDQHFAKLLLNQPVGPPWDAVDFDADPDWEWRTAADDGPDLVLAQWEASVARSRSVVSDALIQGGMDYVGAYATRTGHSPNLRRILLDLIEEYARHAGHADLIRESIDGLTGEDPGNG